MESDMSYQGDFHDIVYPDEHGKPCVLQYRIAFSNTPELLAVLHLRQLDPAFASPVASPTIRDQVLNRVIGDQFAGIPVNAIRVAIEDVTGVYEFELEFDLHDYLLQGRPYDATPVLAGGGRVREEISISSDRIIAGSVRVHTTHASPTAPSPEVAGAIA
ncbi:hypothetical protein LFL96_36830 (plasmid) [Paraburkholderia sp. D15]|uniref:hypothetical protein n=1 Tax=Paraburkholderia sp. D15 TaxID=2880218 RepID=UPI0024786F0D|nr:hypothetical protein [Paraburkholderia sp. D15]WGS55044.1 hypothetical protein LFL96_36830 [Paraburkholderia sp. D15]